MKSLAPVLVAAAALSACAHDGAPAPNLVFSKLGEVAFQSGSAAWDEDQVMGPIINVSQRSDGTWAGRLGNQIVDITVRGDRAVGSYLTMKWEVASEKTIITAQWLQNLYRFEFHPNEFIFRGPRRSFTLQNRGGFLWGPTGELRIDGSGREKPLMPQFALALLGTFVEVDASLR